MLGGFSWELFLGATGAFQGVCLGLRVAGSLPPRLSISRWAILGFTDKFNMSDGLPVSHRLDLKPTTAKGCSVDQSETLLWLYQLED